MLINLLIGLPVMLLCLVLQAGFTFWSIRFHTGRLPLRAPSPRSGRCRS
jgi:hypothetical protein